MTTHMESNRKRIAKVRAENIARQERKAKPKPKAAAAKQQHKPSYVPSDPATFTTNPNPDLLYAFVEDGDHMDMVAVYKGQRLDWTREQVSTSLHLTGAIIPAFNRQATNTEYEVIVKVVSEQA